MIFRVLLAGFLLALGSSAYSQTPMYSSSHRISPYSDYVVWGTEWYSGPVCGPYSDPTNPFSSGISLHVFQSAETLCASEAAAQASQMRSLDADETQCYTAVGSLGTQWCPEACSDPSIGLVMGCFVQTCDVTVYKAGRPKTVYVPAFVVQSINYAIPGNTSSITYTDSSARGSTWITSFEATNEIRVGWDEDLYRGSGTSLVLKSTWENTTSLQTEGTYQETRLAEGDVADHTRDLFTLWVNPTLTRYTGCELPDLFLYGATYEPWIPPGLDPTWPVLMEFTAAELANPAIASNPYKYLFLQQLSTLDIQEGVLALNPFIMPDGSANPQPVLNRDRFRPIQAGATNPCPTAFAGVSRTTPRTCTAKYIFSEDSTWTFDATWTLDAKFPILGIPSSNVFTLKYTRTESESTTNTNSAAISLGTSTEGVCIDGQLFIDTMFNTYAVPSFTGACP